MSTPILTGGSITYGRTVKVADYENKKLDLTLAFNVAEGETLTSEQLDGIANEAINFVHAKLGLEPRVKSAGAAAPVSPPPSGTSDASRIQPPKAAAPKKPAKPPVIEVQLTDEDKRQITAAPEDRKDPSAITDDHAAEVVEGYPDVVIEDDIFTADAQPITDATLTDAVTKHNAKIKNPIAIRGLIGKFVKPGEQLINIPPALRQKFLDDLHAL